MSIDFSLRNVNIVFHSNMTHNVSSMWSLAGIYDEVYNSQGQTAKDILPRLQEGLDRMKKFPTAFKTLNPENGWGTYEHAVKFLEEIVQACKEYPNSEIFISK